MTAARQKKLPGGARAIGVTGGIGMGKSTVTRLLARRGVRTLSSDAIVHELMQPGGKAVAEIKKYFPSVITPEGGVDRKALGAMVFNDKSQLRRLESILHPRVVAAEIRFARAEARKGAKWIVLDIPLLFETHAQARLHRVLVASAPAFIQRRRVLARPGMTKDKFAAIIKAQLPDRAKRRKADYVIATGLGKAVSARQIETLFQELMA